LFGKELKMLWTVFLILMVSWALGLATLPALGGFIHLPLFFALMTRAIDLGRELADGPQVAMRLLKRSIYNAAELTFAQSLDEIAAKTAISDHHPDAAEGMTAFKEKRAPRFNQPRHLPSK